MKKRNGLPVCRFGGLPCAGGGEKKCTHTRKKMSWCGRNGVWIFEVLSLETKNKS